MFTHPFALAELRRRAQGTPSPSLSPSSWPGPRRRVVQKVNAFSRSLALGVAQVSMVGCACAIHVCAAIVIASGGKNQNLEKFGW